MPATFDMKIKAIHLKLSKKISFVWSTLYSYLWVIKCHKNQFLRQYTHSLKMAISKIYLNFHMIKKLSQTCLLVLSKWAGKNETVYLDLQKCLSMKK